MKMHQNNSVRITLMNSSSKQSIIYWRVWTWMATDTSIIPSIKQIANRIEDSSSNNNTHANRKKTVTLHISCSIIQLISVLCCYLPLLSKNQNPLLGDVMGIHVETWEFHKIFFFLKVTNSFPFFFCSFDQNCIADSSINANFCFENIHFMY